MITKSDAEKIAAKVAETLPAAQVAKAKVAAAEKSDRDLAAAHLQLANHIDYLQSRTTRQAYKVSKGDPETVADQTRTDAELAAARLDLANLELEHQANTVDLYVCKAELEAIITADLMHQRDEAERAGVAAVVEQHELTVKREIVRQIHGRQRALTNELRDVLEFRGTPAFQHKEIEVQDASKTYAAFKLRLSEIDQKLADPDQYAPARFMPKAPAPAAPAAVPPADWRKTNSLDDYRAQFGVSQTPETPRRVTPQNNPHAAVDGHVFNTGKQPQS